MTHAEAAGDEEMAVGLVERHGTNLLELYQAASALVLLDKLPHSALSSRPRLQLMVAWSNILLHRVRPAERALAAAESLLCDAPVASGDLGEMQAEVGTIRALVAARCDHYDATDELVRGALAGADELSPWVVSAAANLASMAAVHRFDFDAAERRQEWAAPYHARNRGPYARMHGSCCLGIVAHERLEISTAEEQFRQALRTARHGNNRHSTAARLAGALLAEALYEQNHLIEADRLLDESFLLGYEAGAVDVKTVRYIAGVRVKAALGDRAAAAQRLDAGARAAHTLMLPRLRAQIEDERARLRLPATVGLPVRPPLTYPERLRPVHGLDATIAQFDESVGIRALLYDGTPDSMELACTWAQEWVELLVDAGRPRALLRAQCLLVDSLAAAGHTDEAEERLAAITAQCVALGIVRYLLDGGPHLVGLLEDVRADYEARRRKNEWPSLSDGFWSALTPTDS